MKTGFSNSLSNEKSPYLLQHAANPVVWYPWSDAAFDKAKKENKPIFLSIGYSSCHWCHVMAHESFEDTEVAGLMNETFVSVKVDREERPDIDAVYMSVCQMMTGSGGWPLTIIMTPDKQPFFAATYIPKTTRFNRIGLLELIPRVREVWSNRQEEALDSARQITESLNNLEESNSGGELAESLLDETYRQLAFRYDSEYGGFGDAPKFPTPHNLLFLLRHYKRTNNKKALEMVENTLQAMRNGGIYDHGGFGFHRYSTDSRWLVPHFEKMLYDQALLAVAYIEAFQATGKYDYQNTAREIFIYVLRDMTAAEGGFYSAEDADSEGEEGKFYIWTTGEIQEALTAEEAELAIKVFNLDPNGNFSDEVTGRNNGHNILHMTAPVEKLSHELGVTPADLRRDIEKIRHKLYIHREKRVRPGKDDKILADWNGLMIAALAKGAQVFGEPGYADAAAKAAGFILTKMRTPEGRLLHRYRDEDAAVTAGIDDYAFLIYGLIELYEATFDADYIKTAENLCDDSLRFFWDDINGGFYYTAEDSEKLLVRRKEIYDGAVPSGNSVAMLNLLRLARITGRSDFEEKAGMLGRAFSGTVEQSPSAHTQLMLAVDFAAGPSYELIIAGDPRSADTENMLNALRKLYVPNKVILLHSTGMTPDDTGGINSVITDYPAINGQTTAYVCIDFSCRMPTTDIPSMISFLDSHPH